ncbi:MAG TPA: hypothetical protein VGP36_16825 [Mycobacteriales bacterium]|nr:hypothetical protein [Mycobacteriales bacterium]
MAGIVDRAAAPCPYVLRVAVDGHPAAAPAALADALVDPLRLAGRPVLRVGSDWFLRPASVRLERGRTDPDAFYDDRLDAAALRREVLDPLGPGGSGSYLPTLWDPTTDRATRAAYVAAPPKAVLIVDGTLLLGQGLPFDLTVHLRLSAGARERRTDESARWMLPAYTRYEQEVGPESVADVLIRVDDPRHPALSFPTG